MPKTDVKPVKFSRAEMAYELPRSVPLSRLRRVGRGEKVVERLLQVSLRTVVLAPDVFEDFRTAKEVNEALRLVQKLRRCGEPSKRRKSA